NETTTLMRTTIEENEELGKIIATKLNEATGPTTLYLPLKGVSLIDVEGQPFYGPEENAALFESIRKHLNSNVELIEVDSDINDDKISIEMAKKLVELLKVAKVV